MSGSSPPGRPTLRVGMIGHAFMGAAHSHAWRTAPHFFDLPLCPEQAVLAGRDAERTRAAATRLGWADTATGWRSLVARDDVDLVDICTPGDTHADEALAFVRRLSFEPPAAAFDAAFSSGEAEQ